MPSVKIYSIHFNRPDHIFWQYDSFKAHMKDQYELIIVNNAIDDNIRNEINKIVSRLSPSKNISVIETKYLFTLAGKHHANCFNEIWQNYATNDKEFVIMMDGDVFIVQDF